MCIRDRVSTQSTWGLIKKKFSSQVMIKNIAVVSLALLLLSAAQISLAESVSNDKFVIGLLVDHDATSNTVNKLKKQIDNGNYDDQDLSNLIAHNIGILDTTLSSERSAFINKYGSKNVLSPKLLDYVVLVKTNNANLRNLFPVKTHEEVEFSKPKNKDLVAFINDNIFNRQKNNSLVKTLDQVFHKERNASSDDVAYFFTHDIEVLKKYNEEGVYVDVGDYGKLEIIEMGAGKVHKTGYTIEQCLDSNFQNVYDFDLEFNEIYSHETNTIFSYDEYKAPLIANFLKDMCVLIQTGKMVRKQAHPIILSFYIDSLSKLEDALDPHDINFMYSLWNESYLKFIKSLGQFFAPNDISGQVIVSNEDFREVLEATAKAHVEEKKVFFTQINEVKRIQPIIAAEVRAFEIDDENAQVYYWVPVGLAFILAYILYYLFNMDVGNDTVIYAKFLANEGRQPKAFGKLRILFCRVFDSLFIYTIVRMNL
eukprot:TRINITY_DN97_c0_g1_i4.p1 TRINITY_DN97_c0_g1~~TRINITY_DN97_c0_g1_i4.p1  ORF type:complete len:506 (+),score=222.38 TRINITY_DN97_c0_g1_i4:74-1519(+)